MRIAFLFLFVTVFMLSCGQEAVVEEKTVDTLPLVCELPNIESGVRLDTSLPEFRIMVRKDSTGYYNSMETYASFNPDSCSDTINIYIDKDVYCGLAETFIDSVCRGKTIFIVGNANGEELGIPFHPRKRFPETEDSTAFTDQTFRRLFVNEDGIVSLDYPGNTLVNLDKFFTTFYGNAFFPRDTVGFPPRIPDVQTISVLEQEAMIWDQYNSRFGKFKGRDSASTLAGYNEFVNKLEIFQKVNVFYTFPLAFVDISPENGTKWNHFVRHISCHRKVQEKLRADAKRYLSDHIANLGSDVMYQFTEEDLRLLYPDRLRWHGRMSGAVEHHYDPFYLKGRLVQDLSASD